MKFNFPTLNNFQQDILESHYDTHFYNIGCYSDCENREHISFLYLSG